MDVPSRSPKIKTAIPRCRYQIGEFTVVVLSDIESDDGVTYQYILALMREGEARPCFYITLEKNPRSEVVHGSHRMRMIAQNYNEVLGSANHWAELEVFVAEALARASRALQLGDEQPTRLM